MRTPLGPLGSQLAPKGDVPGNVNLLSLRFHNIITIIIYIIIIMIMTNNTDTVILIMITITKTITII